MAAQNLHLDVFAQAWKEYPRRPGNNRKAAERMWSARIREGCDPQEMLAGAVAYRKYCETTGSVGTNFVKQGSTFFGPDHHFATDYAHEPQPRQEGAAADLMEFYSREQLV